MTWLDARKISPGGMPAVAASSVPTKVKQSTVNSEQKWLGKYCSLLLTWYFVDSADPSSLGPIADLSELLLQAKSRFADVTWVADDGTLVHGHKCIVYARAAGETPSVVNSGAELILKCIGGFQQRYLSTSVPLNESSRSLPYQPFAASQRSLLSTSQDWHEQGQFKRGSSPNGSLASNNTVLGQRREIRVDLQGTDAGTFSGYLTTLYTAQGTEVFEVLFEG